MADLNNVNPLALAPGAAPLTNTNQSAGPDRFPAQVGARYLVRLNNTGGAPVTMTWDDPTSVAPASAKAFNPDVDVVVTNAQARVTTVDGNRFRNSDGYIYMTWSGAMTGSVEIHGPL
jgi:hypothetical protein